MSNNDTSNTPSRLQQILQAGHLAVTSECGPPRSADGKIVEEKARIVGPVVDAINITDNQTAVVRLCSIASAVLMSQQGVEPIMQMTCRDRNRIAIQGDLLGAAALGIENLPLPRRRPSEIRRPSRGPRGLRP